jgi:hypothetical protein
MKAEAVFKDASNCGKLNTSELSDERRCCKSLSKARMQASPVCGRQSIADLTQFIFSLTTAVCCAFLLTLEGVISCCYGSVRGVKRARIRIKTQLICASFQNASTKRIR